ncbi:DUF192 domain-containing protein [Streptomyces sp. NRRL F-5126]|uniref:DUF192 domain-containing protein n=1 Tax=Streptomyces sp. NRRL F-5126 TaxID=1463857 RepID=UPI00055CAEE0|nr:DUF192 domain-containing protein [Streptomyces sp. NRRL F-5126]
MGEWHDGAGTLTIETGTGTGTGPGSGRPRTVPVEIAASYRTRRRGLLGRNGVDGALLLTPCGSVHTFGMRFAIDVAYLDRHLRVLRTQTLRPGRMPLPRLRARHVLEAEAGAMAGWGLRAGATVRIEPGPPLT